MIVGRYSKVIRELQEAIKALEKFADMALAEQEAEIVELREENERYRKALEVIAGSSDRLQALQATAALDNIGARV